MEKQDAAAGARPPTADDAALRELQAKLDELLQWKRDVSPLLEAIDPPAAARRAERPAATTDDDDPGGIGDDGLSRMLSSTQPAAHPRRCRLYPSASSCGLGVYSSCTVDILLGVNQSGFSRSRLSQFAKVYCLISLPMSPSQRSR